jgi:hypothetical protein
MNGIPLTKLVAKPLVMAAKKISVIPLNKNGWNAFACFQLYVIKSNGKVSTLQR